MGKQLTPVKVNSTFCLFPVNLPIFFYFEVKRMSIQRPMHFLFRPQREKHSLGMYRRIALFETPTFEVRSKMSVPGGIAILLKTLSWFPLCVPVKIILHNKVSCGSDNFPKRIFRKEESYFDCEHDCIPFEYSVEETLPRSVQFCVHRYIAAERKHYIGLPKAPKFSWLTISI